MSLICLWHGLFEPFIQGVKEVKLSHGVKIPSLISSSMQFSRLVLVNFNALSIYKAMFVVGSWTAIGVSCDSDSLSAVLSLTATLCWASRLRS